MDGSAVGARLLHERLRDLGARYPVDEDLVFGLDVGIASIGSAVLRHGDEPGILFAGSRCFEAPEEPKTKELTNKTRRDSRLLRRVVRRRARRMKDIRQLLADNGLLPDVDARSFHNRRGAPGPWQARAGGLDRRLDDQAFAAALLHIAKHRGFKSTKKSDTGQNAPDDNRKMLGAIAENRELSQKYRTVGEMAASEPKFGDRKRNKGGEYTHTFARDDLRDEVGQLFAAQKRLGNPKATPELEEAYASIAFFQRSLQDSEHLVGPCPFEPDEKRAPRGAPSFELFRFLSKLNTVRIRAGDGSLRRLTREELGKAAADFGTGGKTLTWNALAKKIGLSKDSGFDGIDADKAKKDIAAAKGCAAGTHVLYQALGAAGWNTVRGRPELLDTVAAVVTFRDDLGRIEAGLSAIEGLDPMVRDALVAAARDGAFGDFTGVGHISARAARNILPGLLDGKVYSDACAMAGYDHAQARRVGIEDIRNPVVQRSLREAVRQVETLVHEFGARPGRIIVELARDVGKSARERDEMTRGIDKRTAERDRHRKELVDLLDLGRDPNDEELRRYELWKEQNYRCVYTDTAIAPHDILGAATQVDHAMPRSRSQDNSYANQVLCFAKANQDKGRKTVWEWKGQDEAWWAAFEARVRALSIKGMKKRNLLMRNFDERQQGFVERNLNDTKYSARALLSALRHLYPAEAEPDPSSEGYLRKKRRLFARPGGITALLRKAWGLDGVKDRADDRHHALDAMVCAAARNEWLLNSLTRQYQEVEVENRAKWTPSVPAPWPGFRDDALAAYEAVFVSRSERRRGRGQGHKDTIYRVGHDENGGKITFERKAVASLTQADLGRIKDADGGNRPLARALTEWLDRGKPADDPPRSAKGDPVRKVLLARRGKDAAGFTLNGGHVDNVNMIRTDVFLKDEKFYLVPIYAHQIANFSKWPRPPMSAITAHKPERDWVKIDESYEFIFSLFADSYVEVARRQGGVVHEGYFRGTDIGSGNIELSPHNYRADADKVRGIGARTLVYFKKFHVDRLGRKHEIRRESRTWHGTVCT